MANVDLEPPKVDHTKSCEEDTIHVLHVDDETGLLEVSKQILELQGSFQVDSARSVEEAYTKMSKNKFDVIVSDYQMPIKDGLEFLGELRDNGNSIPFILFTGRGREEVAIEALNLGADRYLSKNGKPETVYGELAHAILQVVENKKGEHLLDESEERFKLYVENSPIAVFVANPEGKYEYVNEAASRLLGFSKEELLEMSIPQVTFKQNNPITQNRFVELKKTGRSLSEIALKTKDGLPVYVILNSVKLPDGNLMAFCENITERKKAEESLKKAEKEYRTVFENTGTAMCMLEEDKTISRVNRRFVELSGYSKEEVEGKKWTFFITEKCLEQMQRYHEARRKSGKKPPTHYDFEFINKNGEIRNGLLTIELIPETKQSIASIIDITNLKKADEDLRKSEDEYILLARRFRSILDSSADSILVTDLDGSIIDCNESALKLGEYSSKKEIFGMNVFQLISVEDRKRAQEVMKEISNTEKLVGVELIALKKNGEPFSAEISGGVIKDSAGNPSGFVFTTREITEKKNAEKLLKKSEEKYRNLFEMAPDGIATLDMKGTITSVNPAFLRLTGFSIDEIVGKNFTKIGTIRARDTPKNAKLISSILRRKTPKLTEFVYVRKDGTKRFCEAHLSLLELDGKKTVIQAVLRDITERIETAKKIRDLAKFAYENPNPVLRVAKDGTVLFANAAAKQVLKKEKAGVGKLVPFIGRQLESDVLKSGFSKEKEVELEGKVFSFVFNPIIDEGYVNVYGQNITGRKKAEKLVLEAIDELSSATDKLGVVGRLTRHDVRNKLSVIVNNVYLAKQRLTGDQVGSGYLEDIELAVNQAEKIFDFARTYEKLGTEKLSNIDVGKSFERAASLRADLSGIEVVTDCSGVNVLTDSLLDTLFYNLIDNSIKHGEKVSRIRIYHKTGKDGLKLIYEDNGVGIPAAEKELIFKEGYGKNTGLGLYMIKKMCNVYGWTIQETGKQGNGAQFTITIPKKRL